MKQEHDKATFGHNHMIKQIQAHNKEVDEARVIVKASRNARRKIINDFIQHLVRTLTNRGYRSSDQRIDQTGSYWGGLITAGRAGLKWKPLDGWKYTYVSKRATELRRERADQGRIAGEAIRRCHELDDDLFHEYPKNRRCELFAVDWSKFNKMLDKENKK